MEKGWLINRKKKWMWDQSKGVEGRGVIRRSAKGNLEKKWQLGIKVLLYVPGTRRRVESNIGGREAQRYLRNP